MVSPYSASGSQCPWRIFQQTFSKKYPPFKVIATHSLPMGDFDVAPPRASEPLRIYKTRKGYRVFYIARHNEVFSKMLSEMMRQGADSKYIMFCARMKAYYARIEPKSVPCGNFAVTRLIGETGERRPEWDDFIRVHDDWTRATEGGLVLI